MSQLIDGARTTRSYGVPTHRTAPLRLARHADAPDRGSFRQWLQESARPIAIDLFSGAGGLSHGLEAAGYRVALAVDTDQWALETYAHNFEGLALRLDLTTEESRDAIVELFQDIEVSLVAGGPPCQPYSRAARSKIRSLVENGSREGVDQRRDLWQAFVAVVEKLRPKAVLIENVPDMALGDDGAMLRTLLRRLEQAGYEVDARIVDAWLYRVPQHRQRLVVVGLRGAGRFAWPDPAGRVSLQDAIGDLPALRPEAGDYGAEILPYTGAASEFQRRARSGCVGEAASSVHDHLTRAVRHDDMAAFRLMKAGTLYCDLPEELRRYRADIFDDKYNRLSWEDLSRSITAHLAKDGYWYIHPDQHRTLTVREAARIQTFPDHFRFAGARSHQFTQIGNAVPPALAEAIGAALLRASDRKEGPGHALSVWRRRYRELLGSWASQDAPNAPWAYPGDHWQVTVGLLLGGKQQVGWPGPGDALAVVPTYELASKERLAVLSTMARPKKRQAAVERLSEVVAAVSSESGGWEGEKWVPIAAPTPAARRWLELLALKRERLILSASVLRVTARMTGTEVDQRNQLSEGRIELAKLLGDGSQAAILNAAMQRLGKVICKPERPQCSHCPVGEVCKGRLC